MKKIFILLSFMAVVSCNNTNPFFAEWDTPYGIPDFENIKVEHYVPAIEEGVRQQQAEIDAIIADTAEPTFENVVAAYDRSGALLDKVTGVLMNLSESDATPEMLAVVEEVLPLLTEHSDNIFMNPAFFAKVDALYQKKADLGLNREQEMLLDKMHRSFVNNGIALNEADQARMREINKALASLSQTFGNNLLAENNAFAEEFGVTISEYPMAMASTEDRALRERMFKAYSTRGANGNEHDNMAIIKEMTALRIEKAKLLGYDCPANMILSDKMAGNAETVDTFLSGLMGPAVAQAKKEIVDMQKVMDDDIAAGILPKGSVIEAWDWAYYAEKVRKEKYALDEDQVRPYFQMENVRQGVFDLVGELFGLSFEKVEDAPLYHPEVEVFKVTDADGSYVGIFSTDYFPRSTKRGGAWMSNFSNQYVLDGQDVRPVILNIGNFAKPEDGKPALLTLDNVETLFHEFGHALHGLLSQCTYKTVSGTSVSRDFVELPSQIMENWAFHKDVLAKYARHYETGEVIPDSLVDKIIAASNFNQGFMTTELVAASILDMKWHELTSVEGLDPVAFEAAVCKEMGLIDEIIPRYRSSYFAHIFSGGYSAGYYSYLWAEVLDQDAFDLFRQKGVYDKETAMSFRENILEKGGSEEPMVLYRRFRGADPDSGALLRGRGL